METKTEQTSAASAASRCSAWLGGVKWRKWDELDWMLFRQGATGIGIGLAIATAISMAEYGIKKFFNDDAKRSASNASPYGKSKPAQLSIKEPALPLVLGANELRGAGGELGLLSGKLLVFHPDKDGRSHFLESSGDIHVPLHLVKLIGNGFLIFVHTNTVTRPNDPSSATAKENQ